MGENIFVNVKEAFDDLEVTHEDIVSLTSTARNKWK